MNCSRYKSHSGAGLNPMVHCIRKAVNDKTFSYSHVYECSNDEDLDYYLMNLDKFN